MGKALRHRGPDAGSSWSEGPCTLTHRRLSIIDLSPAGAQPMVSAGGRYSIVFNGEIYNFASLKEELAGQGLLPPLRGHSDTEIMLAAIEGWGLAKAVRAFTGMFAFALWDNRESRLHLVRDRLGVKPLYYGWIGGLFAFASELKALRALPGFSGRVDAEALDSFLRDRYITGPRTIYTDVFKLPPGCMLSVDPGARPEGFVPEADGQGDGRPVRYWSARDLFALPPDKGLDPRETLDRLHALIRDAVRLRMVADVPVGAFLSGGVDSSLIVAVMQEASSRPVKTFTIGFREGEYNEARHGTEVARLLGTDHTELIVDPSAALDVIPVLPEIFDEPFADVSQIPTYLLCRMTRRHVTVSLSGDGGDELFLGYNRYFGDASLLALSARLPALLRHTAASALAAVPAGAWTAAATAVNGLLPGRLPARPDEKARKFAAMLRYAKSLGAYRSLMGQWNDTPRLVPQASGAVPPGPVGGVEAMNVYDILHYLPEDVMTKVDRASMAVSLEAREPLLDHRLFEFAARMPTAMKFSDGRGKWPLRMLVERYLPKAVMERPKQGFDLPIGAWLRGPLKEWADQHLSGQGLGRLGEIDPKPVARKWREHSRGGADWTQELWNVLMFSAWKASQRA